MIPDVSQDAQDQQMVNDQQAQIAYGGHFIADDL